MELRHLRYFIAIAEEENFRRAADRLHVSQSPLSRQMQQLEDEIGADLFEPAGRGVRLTAAGRLFLEKARSILASVDAATREAKETSDGRIGTLTIGFEGSAAMFDTLSTLLSRFRTRAPSISIDLVRMSSAQQWEALASHRISLGYGNHAPDDSSLQSVVLARHQFGILMPGDHRLASKPRIRVADLVGETLLLDPRSENPRLHDDIIAAVRAHGVSLDGACEVPDATVLFLRVASGLGLTFGTETMARLLAGSRWRPVSDLGLAVREIVMWRPVDAQSPLLRPFLEIARELRAELRAPPEASPRKKARRRAR